MDIPRSTVGVGTVRNNYATATDKVPDPQMLTQLGECVRNFRDLRNRLQDINSRLRGIRPEPEGENMKDPEPKVPHLGMVLSNLRDLLEQCHAEATEAQAHLS